MPRPKKPARLWQRYDTTSDRQANKGRGNDNFEWVVLDAGKQHRTGYRGHGGAAEAERVLARYLSQKLSFPTTPQPPEELLVSTVLVYYLDNLRAEMVAPERQAYAVKALGAFWAKKCCAEINESLCRSYARSRPSSATARRELGVLRAALNKAAGNILTAVPPVWLPPKGKPRPDWLTRDEFASLLWALWRQRRSRHAARLALCQFYTGSRPRTVSKSTWAKRTDGPWIDLDLAIWWRSGDEEPETVKRRRPHAIPDRLLPHLVRWKRIYGGTFVVEHPRHPGKAVMDIGTALEGAAKRAGIKRITPHTLKHTAITLAIQGGMLAADAAEYFSTSIETIERDYWHHSPYYQHRAVVAVSSLGRMVMKRNETRESATKSPRHEV